MFLPSNILTLKVLSSIDSIIRSPRRAPLITLTQKKGLGKSWAEEESGFEHLPAVIETWADQLMALKVLVTFDCSLQPRDLPLSLVLPVNILCVFHISLYSFSMSVIST